MELVCAACQALCWMIGIHLLVLILTVLQSGLRKIAFVVFIHTDLLCSLCPLTFIY